MNIYGIMMAKNEDDILSQTITSLQKHGGFTNIFFYDNASTDKTFEVAKKFNSQNFAANSITTPFSDNLKFELLNSHHAILKDGDWIAILDADELYQEDLLPLIEKAEKEGANYIECKSAQFYFTDKDSSFDFIPDVPACEQRKYYLLNYGEPRIFRYSSEFTMTADLVKQRHAHFKKASESLLIHHFQFRSEQQTQRRLNDRLQNNSHSKNWGHVNSPNWKDYFVCPDYLHEFNGKVQTGLPANANLYKIKNNTAYTMANLNWLKKNNYLTEEQLKFFTASRIERLFRKFF